MEDLDNPNREMQFDDYPHNVSVYMGNRIMHVYFDSSNGRHGFEVFTGNNLIYQSEAKYYSLKQARSAGIDELKLFGGSSAPVIKLVDADSERKLA